MKNPFRYGVPVSGDFYFPRPVMVKQMLNYSRSGQKILFYGPRRFGKTSFLKEYSDTLKKEKITPVYIDLYPITSHRDFLTEISASIKESHILSTGQRIKDIINELFRIRPRLIVDGDTTALDMFVPSISDEDVRSAIEDTIRLLGNIHKEQPLAVIFDEFQKIAEIDDDGWLEASLRSEIQKQGNLSYIFCGSRRGLILDMFQNSSRPFYQMCTPIELPRMDKDFAGWIMTKLNSSGVTIDREMAIALLDKVDWNPNYAQMIAFHLVADNPEGAVTAEDIVAVLDDLCQLNGYTYTSLFDSLSLNAQKTLRLVAANRGQSPFSKKLLNKFDLTSSSVQAAIQGLVNKHILDDTSSGKNIIFDDPLFLRWIEQRFVKLEP